MAVRGDFQVKFDDFRGGHAGSVDPAFIARNQWYGKNVKVYRSGLIGPRGGFKAWSISGLGTYSNTTEEPRGLFVVRDLVMLPVGTSLMQWRIGEPSATLHSTFPVTPSGPISFAMGHPHLYSVNNGQLRRHAGPGGATAVDVTTPVPLAAIIRFGLWMVGFPQSGNRIYFNQVDASGPNYDSWPANNFYQFGDKDRITALRVIGNTLYVGTAGGWYAITGVLGDFASIRQVAIGQGPTLHRLTATGWDNRIWYWGPTELVGTEEGSRAPAVFNGADPVSIDEGQMASAGPDSTSGYVFTDPIGNGAYAVAPASGRTIILAGRRQGGTTTMLVRTGDAWSYHELAPGLEIGAFAPNDISEGTLLPRGVIVAARHASVSTTPQIYTWQYDLDRPGRQQSDPWSQPGDGSTSMIQGQLTLAPYWEPNGKPITVRRVTVQFRAWPTGSSTAHLSCRVRVLGPLAGGLYESAIQQHAKSLSGVSVQGEDDSWPFIFGDQGPGHGFQIEFPLITGIAIRSVVVDCEMWPGRG